MKAVLIVGGVLGLAVLVMVLVAAVRWRGVMTSLSSLESMTADLQLLITDLERDRHGHA